MAAALLAGAPMLWSACSDTWNEHYDVVPGGMADQPSLLENITADPNLANFAKVIKAIGGAELLASPQQFTVWAPKSLTAEQADSIIKVYNDDVTAGMKWEDNKAVTQFLQNHMALYARPVSAYTNDTVTMRNRKYMQMIGTDDKSGTLGGNKFGEMTLCNNGILYKTDGILQFFPNVREFTELNPKMTKLTEFLKSYDEYELNESASTPGGIEDGKTIYLDSVTTIRNKVLNSLAFIEREDSVYTFLAPTDDVWDAEYERYGKMFVYNNSVPEATRDSLAQINTSMRILSGRFFNTSKNWRYNFHPTDSLCNTNYGEQQVHNPRRNVFYNPEKTLLNGLDKITCSNGFVYVDDKGVIDPHKTFFGRTDMDASSAFYYEAPKDKNNVSTMNVSNRTYEVYEMDTTYVTDPETGDEITVISQSDRLKKRYNYVEVTAKTAQSHTELEYKVPGTLSNVYYNVYVVVACDRRNDLPLWFQVQQSVQNEKGVFGTKASFVNPHAVTEGSVENSDVILKQSNSNRCYVADPTKMDTILIQSGVKYDFSGYGVDDGVVKYTISSFGPSATSYRERIYTRTLRLNEIILIPFETKEEAEAAADDLDAFNDVLLEGIKEN